MNTRTTIFRRSLAAAALVLSTGLAAAAAAPIDVKVDGFTDQYAQVNGVRLHYKIGGQGSPVVLLHGYGQTGHMWTPAMKASREEGPAHRSSSELIASTGVRTRS